MLTLAAYWIPFICERLRSDFTGAELKNVEILGRSTEGSFFLFQSRKGKPLSSSNIVKRHLHPALEKLGFTNPITGTAKAGTHAFRRFRDTYLKNHTACPSGLYKYWLGHAPTDMSDLYDKVKYDVGFRREWAEKRGIRFELFPIVIPNIPKNQPSSASSIAV